MDPLSLARRGEDQIPHPLSSSARALVSKLAELRTGGQANASAAEEDGALSPLSLSDEEVDGVRRLAPDPDSPTSRLLEQAAKRTLKAAAESGKGTPERFNFAKDIASNPQLAKAARAQLLGTSPRDPAGSEGLSGAAGGGVGHLQHSAEIDRQTAVIDQLDRDAREESAINQGLASVMLGRLQSARGASERVLGVLQAFAGAEAAYGRAMEAAARVSMTGEGDGPSLRAAMEGVGGLPMMMGAAHSQLATRLSELIKLLQSVLTDLRAACEEISHGAGRAKRSVDGSRRALKAALAAHQEACRAFDLAAAEQQRRQGGGGRWKGVDQDPWLAEGRLVERQTALQRAQQEERQYLAKAFQRVGDLERRRAAALKEVFAGVVGMYKGAGLSVVQSECSSLEGPLASVDPEADLAPFWDAAASAVRTGDALSARQAETLGQISGELLASPHIVRQGQMERWESATSKWVPSHLVLTQAGFLHFFDGVPAAAAAAAAAAAGGGKQQQGGGGGNGDGGGAGSAGASNGGGVTWGGPATCPVSDSMNLSRCAFEQGEAPIFRIIESLPSLGLFGSKSRTRTLRGDSVEDCMYWAAAIRDAIASTSGR